MSDLIFVVVLALCAVFFALLLKESRMPILALLIPLAAGILILLHFIPSLIAVFREVREVSEGAGLSLDYVPLLLKAVVVAYLGEFAASLCRDAEEEGLAKKVELSVKIILMLMALPLLKAILNAALSLLE